MSDKHAQKIPLHMRRARMQRRARFVFGIMAVVGITYRMFASY